MQILEIQLGRVRQRLAGRDMELELTGAAKEVLAERGYDPAFGARPLKRLVQQTLLDPLATEILAGKLRPGSRVIADIDGLDAEGEPKIVLRASAQGSINDA